jgi:hypothetical protein
MAKTAEQWIQTPPFPTSHFVDSRIYTDETLFKEEQEKINKENIRIWKKDILSQLPSDYITIFKECGSDRQIVCYTFSDPIELKNYLDSFKSKIEKMIVLDNICWADDNIEYFNDTAIWDIYKDLPTRIRMAVADLDTKDKQMKLIKSSKNIKV